MEQLLRKRDVFHPGRDARVALTDVARRFARWRLDQAMMLAHLSGGRLDEEASRVILARSKTMRVEIARAREDVSERLANLPPAVTGHSRVTDIARALDGIEASLDSIEQRLTDPMAAF